MAKKTNEINVTRIGKHSGHPITSKPIPVRNALFTQRVP